MPSKFKDVVEARVAATTTSDPALLRELADYDFLYVRLAVAQNPASSAEVLRALIASRPSDDSYQVAAAALRHPASGSEHCVAALELLGTPPSHIEARNWAGRDFIRALFSHSGLPMDRVQVIAPSLPDHLRSLVATSSTNRGVLHIFSLDRSTTIARKASNSLHALEACSASSIASTIQPA